MSMLESKTAVGVISAILVLVAAVTIKDSFASLQGAIKPHEVKLLPEYCPHTIAFAPTYGSRAGTEYWMQRLGDTFKAMHHYCWALVALNRANRFSTTPAEKRHNFSTVVSDIEFVLRYADDKFPLMPEMLTRRAEALIQLKAFSDAERDLRRAIALKDDYWPAYAKLADCFGAQGKKAQAVEVLKEGIRKAGDPRMLQGMLDELERTRR